MVRTVSVTRCLVPDSSSEVREDPLHWSEPKLYRFTRFSYYRSSGRYPLPRRASVRACRE